MAKKETLGGYLNRNIKEKGSSLAAEKAKGKKYKSISAAKKAGALYYTNKSGQVMAAVYAEDLKVRPKAKPGGSAVSPRAGVGGGIFAGKGAGKDKAKAKSSTAQDNNPNKKLAGADDFGTKTKDSGGATRDDGPNVAPKRTGSNDKTSAARTSAARVKAKDNIEQGKVATNTPATATNQDPNQNKTGRLSPRLLELQRKRLERQAAKKAGMNKGGMTKGYNEGGLRMVKKGDEEVPFFAADGKGKMNKGGMTKKSGYMGGGMTKKKVMTYNMGGMVKSQTNNLKKGRS